MQSNWKDLVLEQDRDVVGFGVALSRPESTLPRLCPLPRRPSPHSLLTLTPPPLQRRSTTQRRCGSWTSAFRPSPSPPSRYLFIFTPPPTNNDIIRIRITWRHHPGRPGLLDLDGGPHPGPRRLCPQRGRPRVRRASYNPTMPFVVVSNLNPPPPHRMQGGGAGHGP